MSGTMSGSGDRARSAMFAVAIALTIAVVGCGRTPGPVPPRPTDGAVDGSLDASADGASDASADADTGLGPDGGSGTCDPDAVAVTICPDAVCDGLPRWFWSGDRCFPIECGACTGAGCGGGSGSEAECASAHATCEASLCRGTGGTYRWWAEDCGHWQCGRPIPADCLVGGPSCDCGAFRSFDLATGCFDDDSCPVPEPVPDDELCRASGGSWETICCHTDCGEVCAEPCVNPACNCGPGKVFEAGARGCVEASRCFERQPGQTCGEPARCEAGTICCDHCSGAGCFGVPTCDFPLCDDDDTVDMCGNDLDAP